MNIDETINVAISHHRAGQWPEAERLYRQVLAVNPNQPDALHFLGVLAGQVGNHPLAVELISRAIDLKPDYATAYANLGWSLHLLQRSDEAIVAFQRCLQLTPHYAIAHNNLGSVLRTLGRIDMAIASYRRAIQFDPDYLDAWHSLIYTLSFHPDFDPPRVLAEARRFAERFENPLKPLWPKHANDPSPDRKLRIGYVSPDFRGHVVGWNILPLLRHHDRNSFETYCYSNVAQPDPLTEIIRGQSDHWRDIRQMNDEQAAQLIAQDRIDILVDLTLHMADNRLMVFARKPAPVQVTYLGCCGTTGLDAIDYRISDPYLDPPDSDVSCYSEQTIRLPRSFWCYEPGPTPEPAADSNGFITFGCLNNFMKISRPATELWAKILSAVPKSKLLLHANPGNYLQQLRNQFAAAGVDSNRIEFVGQQPRDQYLKTYSRIDVSLDPFPYGGGITTCDSLWMGVPVITLRGPSATSRFGTSILSNVGLPQFIANTPANYVQIATELARDGKARAQLRHGLREKVRSTPLMNAPQFARDMESAYRQVWRTWCTKHR
ncbi:MAG: tetratricopeptide repeat protein [Tepidisphaeraceae bacterium]|jgi:predicted O-linked N-acetylglucosamine transferase (SPINDLY family)